MNAIAKHSPDLENPRIYPSITTISLQPLSCSHIIFTITYMQLVYAGICGYYYTDYNWKNFF